MDLKKAYNIIAEDWHRDHQKDDWWVSGTDNFASLFESGQKILDVGCGGGTKSKYLFDKGLEVTGIDFSEKMVEIAKQENPGEEFLVMDVKDVDKLDEKFDGIFAQAVLLHIPKKEISEIINKLNNLLNPGGYFYIAVKETRENHPEEEIKYKEEYSYNGGIFFSYFTVEEVRKYLTDLDLEIVYETLTPSGNTNWIQIIGRK